MDGLKADAPDRGAVMEGRVLRPTKELGRIVSTHVEAFLSGEGQSS
jgi:hypothetical protein